MLIPIWHFILLVLLLVSVFHNYNNNNNNFQIETVDRLMLLLQSIRLGKDKREHREMLVKIFNWEINIKKDILKYRKLNNMSKQRMQIWKILNNQLIIFLLLNFGLNLLDIFFLERKHSFWVNRLFILIKE